MLSNAERRLLGYRAKDLMDAYPQTTDLFMEFMLHLNRFQNEVNRLSRFESNKDTEMERLKAEVDQLQSENLRLKKDVALKPTPAPSVYSPAWCQAHNMPVPKSGRSITNPPPCYEAVKRYTKIYGNPKP